MALHEEAFTLGVEEEFQIIDPQTRELSPDVERLLPLAQESLGAAAQMEMMLSQIEIATPICANLDEVRRELVRMRGGVIEAAVRIDRQIAAAGTHQFSRWYEQLITPRSRYEQLVQDFQQLVRLQVIFGCHVHVGIRDRERALQVLNRARPWLPLLLTLSANSPFWHGDDTQYASFRSSLWWTSPMSGPPPFFASRDEYDSVVRDLISTECLVDPTRIYWDIRLPERFPTIEFRVMDVCLTLDEAVMMAGLVRALVRTCYEEAERDVPFTVVHPELLRAANWRAARFGFEGELIDFETMHVVPARELLERFLVWLRPALEATGDWERISQGVQDLLKQGNGAMRQCAVYQRTGSMEDVVDYVVAQTARGTEKA